ncbi:molybdenum cofactor biosynthesis protein MoaE [Lewinellaceae bacterium SD302]|nr:molybdenum cofactor biosynthesis protein MoaE [Lewinellaceae bacterium SD302]
MIHVAISPTPLSLQECQNTIQDPECGGLAFFVGDVRRHNQGNTIEQLEFTSYVPMAEKEMQRLAEEIIEETGSTHLYCTHRIGALKIGDTAVIIGAAAKHRDAAFQACRLMIDRLKETVPIWKKEIAEDGSYWINAHP